MFFLCLVKFDSKLAQVVRGVRKRLKLLLCASALLCHVIFPHLGSGGRDGFVSRNVKGSGWPSF